MKQFVHYDLIFSHLYQLSLHSHFHLIKFSEVFFLVLPGFCLSLLSEKFYELTINFITYITYQEYSLVHTHFLPPVSASASHILWVCELFLSFDAKYSPG